MARGNNPFSNPPQQLQSPAGDSPFAQAQRGNTVEEDLEDAEEERVVRSRAPDVRGDRGFNETMERTGIPLDDASEFERMLDNEFEDERLPTPPKIPGYHTCWLTSNNNYDSIGKRQRLGYTVVRADEVPNFNPSNGQSVASYEGAVTCNEMVLHKLPEGRFQVLMNYYHHKRPLADEGLQLQKIADGNDMVDSKGRTLGSVEGDGIQTLERSVRRGESMRAPRFKS